MTKVWALYHTIATSRKPCGGIAAYVKTRPEPGDFRIRVEGSLNGRCWSCGGTLELYGIIHAADFVETILEEVP